MEYLTFVCELKIFNPEIWQLFCQVEQINRDLKVNASLDPGNFRLSVLGFQLHFVNLDKILQYPLYKKSNL